MIDFKDFEDRENESENRSSPDSKKSVTYNEPLKNNSKSVTKFAIGNYSHLLKDPRQVKIKISLFYQFILFYFGIYGTSFFVPGRGSKSE